MWHRLQILITKEQFNALRQAAFVEKVSIAELIRRIIDAWREERK